MGERVAPGGAGDLGEDPRADREVEQVEQVVLVEVGPRGQRMSSSKSRPMSAATRRHAAAVLGQPGDPAAEDVADAGRQPAVVALLEVAGELAQEERVAARLRVQAAHRSGVGIGEQLAHLALGQPPQREAGDGLLALEIGEDLEQRMAVAELVVAVGAEHGDGARAAPPARAGDRAGARSGRPVQVVDDHEQRAAGREPAHEGDHRLEQAPPLRRGVERGRLGQLGQPGPQLGQQPREVGALRAEQLGQLLGRQAVEVPAEQLDPRPEREQLLLVAAAVEDGEVGRGAGRLGHRPRLADPALARDQHSPVSPARALASSRSRRSSASRRPASGVPSAWARRSGSARRGSGVIEVSGAGAAATASEPSPSSCSCWATRAGPGVEPSSSRSRPRSSSYARSASATLPRSRSASMSAECDDSRNGAASTAARAAASAVASSGPSQPHGGAREELERLHPPIGELQPALVDPARLQTREEAEIGDRQHLPGCRGGGRGVALRLRGGRPAQAVRRGLPVDPRVVGQPQAQLGAALDPVGTERLAQP
jgi:hypothetical protein